MNGKYETRLFGIWFELLPQMNDVRINRARARIVFITPDRVEQSIPTQRFHWMRDEISEQRKFFRRQINQFSVAPYFIAPNVHFNVTETINFRCRRRN